MQKLPIRLLFLCLITLTSACQPPSHWLRQPEQTRNIILFIGDGMGTGHREAARWLETGLEGQLAMDSLPVAGWADTRKQAGEVTDSAAAATAIATGVKTANGRLGQDKDGQPLITILQRAQQQGKSVGLITTTPVSHATPAAFAANAASRKEFDFITAQLAGAKLDLLFGGGESSFLPSTESGCHPQEGRRLDGRNLVKEMRQEGYQYVCTAADLTALDLVAGHQVLGLFAGEGMERPFSPSLAEMTARAIDLLGRDPEGFFLMVEGGQIDWASHDNDAVNAVGDTLGLDEAVQVAKAFAVGRDDTLIIVTADHETGGMAPSRPVKRESETACPFVTPNGVPFCVTWTTTGHTDHPVPTTASGPGSERLKGRYPLTHIHEVMKQVLQ